MKEKMKVAGVSCCKVLDEFRYVRCYEPAGCLLDLYSGGCSSVCVCVCVWVCIGTGTVREECDKYTSVMELVMIEGIEK
jgi:hypothetical protein